MNIQDIISKFLAGSAGAEELKHLEEWRKESQENLDELEALQNLQIASTELKGYKSYNVDSAWEKVSSQSFKEAPPIEVHVFPYKKWMSVAAAILVLVFAVNNINKKRSYNETHFASDSEIENYTLPDGSILTLAASSQAEIGFDFRERPKVSIEGRAHFDVVKQEAGNVFKVQLNKGYLEVVGTQFTISDHLDQVEIAVLEGHVIYVLGNRRVDLFEGDKISVIENDILKTSGNIKNFNSWVTKNLIFRNTALQDAIHDLALHYNVEFKLEDHLEIQACQISGTYNNQTLGSILDEWSELIDLKYSINKNQVKLISLVCK